MSIDIQVLSDLAFILQILSILAILLQTTKKARGRDNPRAQSMQARFQTAPTVNARGSLPVAGDRLIAIGQDLAILHYREMSGSGDPALQKRGAGSRQKKRAGEDNPPRAI